MLGGVLGGMHRREAIAVGFALNSRGAMEIILGMLALQFGIISETLFVAIVIMAIVTSAMSGSMIKLVLAKQKKYRLSEVVSPKLYIELTAGDKDSAIREMGQKASEVLKIPADVIIENLLQRERSTATGLGYRIAVPHARLEGIRQPVALVGISREGIDFDARDGKSAKIIFMILSHPDRAGGHSSILGDIARIFKGDGMTDKVMKYSGEKTEQPTDRKREESRKEGSVSYSREVPYVFIFGGLIGVIYYSGSYILTEFAKSFRAPFQGFEIYLNNESAMSSIFGAVMRAGFLTALAAGAVILVLGFVGGVVQVGFSFHAKPLIPSFSKINPFTGLTRIFGKRALGEIVIIAGKCIISGYIFYIVLADNHVLIMNMPELNSRNFFPPVFELLWIFSYKFFIAYAVIAAIDYFFRRWFHELGLKMTKQEIKDELKQTEGDPLIKSKIREAQRRISQARMLQDVPKADVIVTNPTHFAVALQYDRDTMSAPTMTAKGQDFLALRIMDIARKNDVPIVRNPPAARDMFARLEVGDTIPEDLYKIVAEILAFVYKQKNRRIG
ncbi:hypothetical protein CHS0354_001946 [Potamilus streckersoni]|uniref:Flagellar biosynthetic protein FlhB n=1 Tax=Potamilus streckersoni TaxID=2493646 RepID=A0AAE0W7P0_9BIVA|nr:hypothetical protein CHS0354_001946 [Potamilus streckersoni]